MLHVSLRSENRLSFLPASLRLISITLLLITLHKYRAVVLLELTTLRYRSGYASERLWAARAHVGTLDGRTNDEQRTAISARLASQRPRSGQGLKPRPMMPRRAEGQDGAFPFISPDVVVARAPR